MCNLFRLVLVLVLTSFATGVLADSGESTRVDDPKQHAYSGEGGYPYREKSGYILKELDLKPGDVAVDVGAGDGFWTELMAADVGADGTVYASEVVEKKVDEMKEKFADIPQIKPYLCPTDGTGLEENSCDLAFFSKSYHHLPADSHVDYLRHLKSVIKPAGRICIIERHTQLSVGRSKEHGCAPSSMIAQAEEAGWTAVRYELITGTYHFMAIFVQRELFPTEPPREKPAGKKGNPDQPKEK